MSDEKKLSWYDKMLDKFNAVVTKFDLPEDMRHEIESFVVAVAKEQYMSGNKSGIAWLRKQAGAKYGDVLVAVAKPVEVAPVAA